MREIGDLLRTASQEERRRPRAETPERARGTNDRGSCSARRWKAYAYSRLSSRLGRPSLGPEGGGTSTSQGRSYGIFQKAIQRRNVVAAVAAARELPQLSLLDALELTMLIARKDASRYPRVAAQPASHVDSSIGSGQPLATHAQPCAAALSDGDGHRRNEAAPTRQS
jgi:hypothetical protein